MKNKKYLALLIAAGMVMSMTACGGAGQTQESGSAAVNESSSGRGAQTSGAGTSGRGASGDEGAAGNGGVIGLTYMHKLHGTGKYVGG